jgi:transposase
MMNIIAIDVASEVSSVCVLSASGRIRLEEGVATRIPALKKIIKQVPRPRQVVFEEGTQASWLWSELSCVCDDVLVCDPRQNRHLSGQFKSDKNDARNLAKRAQANLLKRVWHGGHELQALRESVRMYQCLTEESTRLKNQIKAVFRSQGITIGQRAYDPKKRKEAITLFKCMVQRERVRRLGSVLDEVSVQRSLALKTMVKQARKNAMYKPLRKIDGIGPVFASMFAAEVGDARRFRTVRQLWSYAGLAVMTHDTAQAEIKNGKIVRKNRQAQTRGLVRAYNRTLKYVLKQSAMTLSRTAWRAQYQSILTRSMNPNNAQLTLARKLAAVMLHVAKTGEKYDITKVFKAQ